MRIKKFTKPGLVANALQIIKPEAISSPTKSLLAQAN